MAFPWTESIRNGKRNAAGCWCLLRKAVVGAARAAGAHRGSGGGFRLQFDTGEIFNNPAKIAGTYLFSVGRAERCGGNLRIPRLDGGKSLTFSPDAPAEQ